MPYSQATAFLGVAAVYRNYTFGLPACGECARSLRNLRVIGSALLFGPWLAWFGIVVAQVEVLAPWTGLIAYAAALSSSAGLAVVLWRAYKARAVRILYAGESEIVYGFRNEGYAMAFGRTNGAAAEWKMAVVRLA